MDFFSIGPFELLLILVVALLVLGPEKVVEFGRSLGRVLREFRKTTSELERAVLEEKEPVKKEEAGEKQDKPKPPDVESGPR